MMEKFSAIDKAKGIPISNFERDIEVTSREYQVQFLLRLKTELERHDEGIVNTCKYKPFR